MRHHISAVAIVMAGLMAVAGCTTTSFAGLAKSSYVDQVSTSVDQVASTAKATGEELQALQKQVDDLKASADRMDEAAAKMEQTAKATAQLQDLAKQVEGRLESLPRQTLEMLVKSIQDYLAK
jgi:peptidoglycan hydrolase CwlO-like protein